MKVHVVLHVLLRLERLVAHRTNVTLCVSRLMNVKSSLRRQLTITFVTFERPFFRINVRSDAMILHRTARREELVAHVAVILFATVKRLMPGKMCSFAGNFNLLVTDIAFKRALTMNRRIMANHCVHATERYVARDAFVRCQLEEQNKTFLF